MDDDGDGEMSVGEWAIMRRSEYAVVMYSNGIALILFQLFSTTTLAQSSTSPAPSLRQWGNSIL